ncbi:hypothetical protein IW262DRAFT_1303045 [Armillaria fumosa]|nr:hypothetical protein IW262DRAFT_1303045 [Armillaria fumosa]
MSLEIGGNVDIMLPPNSRSTNVFKTRTIVIFCLSLAQAGLVISGIHLDRVEQVAYVARITIFLNFDGQILHAFDALAADRFYLSLASLLFLRFQDGVDVQKRKNSNPTKNFDPKILRVEQTLERNSSNPNSERDEPRFQFQSEFLSQIQFKWIPHPIPALMDTENTNRVRRLVVWNCVTAAKHSTVPMVFAATRVSYGGVFDQAERRWWIAVPRDSSSLRGRRASHILTGFNYVTNIEDLVRFPTFERGKNHSNTSALVWPGVQSFQKARYVPEIFASHVAPLVPSSNGRDVTANMISCWGCLSMADDVSTQNDFKTQEMLVYHIWIDIDDPASSCSHRKYYFSYLAAFIAMNMDQLSLGCKHSRKEYIESGIELVGAKYPNIQTPLKRGDDGERKESVRINNCSTLGQRLEFPQIGSEEDGRRKIIF